MGKNKEKIERQIDMLRPYLRTEERIKYLPHNFQEVDFDNLDSQKIDYAGIEFISTETYEEQLKGIIEKLENNPATQTSAYMNTVALNQIQKTAGIPMFRHHGTIIPKDSVQKNETDYKKATIDYLQRLRCAIKEHSRQTCPKIKRGNKKSGNSGRGL